MSDRGVCRSCGAPIRWTRTTHGKAMPVDVDPLPVGRGFRLEPGPLGSRDVIARFATADPAERLYVSHFSTCPNADRHRRRGTA